MPAHTVFQFAVGLNCFISFEGNTCFTRVLLYRASLYKERKRTQKLATPVSEEGITNHILALHLTWQIINPYCFPGKSVLVHKQSLPKICCIYNVWFLNYKNIGNVIYSIFLLKARILQNIYFYKWFARWFLKHRFVQFSVVLWSMSSSVSMSWTQHKHFSLFIFIICLLSLTLLSVGYQPFITILLCSEQNWL